MTTPTSGNPELTSGLAPSLLEQTQARMLLQKLYGFDLEQDLLMIVRLADGSALSLDIEQFESPEAFMSEVERIAGVVSLKELKQKRDELSSQAFGGFLFTLRTQGRLPHWLAVFLDGRTLEPGFEPEWKKRVEAQS